LRVTIGEGVMMTCREFDRRFNDLVDAESEVAAGGDVPGASRPELAAGDLERALVDHAGQCAACQQLAARYQILRRALGAWDSRPVAPPHLAERILASVAGATVPRPQARRRWQLVAAWISVAAACLLVLPVFRFLIAVREWRDRANPPVKSAGPAVELHSVGGSSEGRLADSRVLKTAFAEATSATLDLARFASEPAARISRQVLDAASISDAGAGEASNDGRAGQSSVTMPILSSLAPDPRAAGAMLQDVGDRLASGVAPLSRTARHAFGFLFGSVPAKLESRSTSPAAKKA
jgi:hypothetical protein